MFDHLRVSLDQVFFCGHTVVIEAHTDSLNSFCEKRPEPAQDAETCLVRLEQTLPKEFQRNFKNSRGRALPAVCPPVFLKDRWALRPVRAAPQASPAAPVARPPHAPRAGAVSADPPAGRHRRSHGVAAGRGPIGWHSEAHRRSKVSDLIFERANFETDEFL